MSKPSKLDKELLKRWFGKGKIRWDNEAKRIYALAFYYPRIWATVQLAKNKGINVSKRCLLPYEEFLKTGVEDRNTQDLVSAFTYSLKQRYGDYIRRYF